MSRVRSRSPSRTRRRRHAPTWRSLAETAREVAAEWGVELGEPFALARFSFVAPAGAERRAEGDAALGRRGGRGGGRAPAVGRRGRRAAAAPRHEAARTPARTRADRATISPSVDEDEATRTRGRRRSHALAARRAAVPLDRRPRPLAGSSGRRTGPAAGCFRRRDGLFEDLDVGATTLVHGDFHHHNLLSSDGADWVAIDPKPMLGEPEYDVAPFLWNPIAYRMRRDVTRAEARGVRGRGPRRSAHACLGGDPRLVPAARTTTRWRCCRRSREHDTRPRLRERERAGVQPAAGAAASS